VSFLLTSTDTAVRLGLYMMGGIVGIDRGMTVSGLSGDLGSIARGRYTNPVIQVGIAYVLVLSGQWETLWGLFGSANQLLAALALLTATVWLANWDESKQLVSTGVPMALMVVITVLALTWIALYNNLYQNLLQGGAETLGAQLSSGAQMILGLVLIYIALSLVRSGVGNLRSVRRGGRPAAEPSDD
jgi:carbon starvation protein